MSNVAKKDGASYWIRVAIWLILSFAGWLTPAVGPVTDYGMKILFISDCRKAQLWFKNRSWAFLQPVREAAFLINS